MNQMINEKMAAALNFENLGNKSIALIKELVQKQLDRGADLQVIAAGDEKTLQYAGGLEEHVLRNLFVVLGFHISNLTRGVQYPVAFILPALLVREAMTENQNVHFYVTVLIEGAEKIGKNFRDPVERFLKDLLTT